MKNRLVAFLAIIVALAMLTGCGGGISKAKYDSAVAEKDNVKTQLTKAQADLKAALDQIVQLQASGGGSVSMQTGPTDLSRVSWSPLTYVDKKYGFKVSYPDTWKITTRGTANVPVEIQYDITDLVPGSWAGVIFDTADTQYTKSTLVNLVSTWQDYQYITSGDTVLADNTTPASYVEFIATIDTYLMHIYALGYVDGDHWVYFAVWTIESVTPWDGNLMRQIAHTLNKATANEIATGTPAPTTTPRTTTTSPTTTAAINYTTYTNTTFKFTFKYNSDWIDKQWGGDQIIMWAAADPWVCPGVHIDRFSKNTGATLADVLESPDYMKVVSGTAPQIGTSTDVTNALGTKAAAMTWKYTAADGTVLDCRSYGLIVGDLWFVMSLYQAPSLGTLSGVKPDEVFNSWQFTK